MLTYKLRIVKSNLCTTYVCDICIQVCKYVYVQAWQQLIYILPFPPGGGLDTGDGK